MVLRELKLVLEEYNRYVTDLKEVFMITEDDVIFFAEIGECNKLTVVNLSTMTVNDIDFKGIMDTISK